MTRPAASAPISESGSSRRGDVAVVAHEWLDLIEREYLCDFIAGGGAAVKFAVGDQTSLATAGHRLAELAQQHGFVHVALDAAATRLHLVQDVFFAVSRTLDWNVLAQRFIEGL